MTSSLLSPGRFLCRVLTGLALHFLVTVPATAQSFTFTTLAGPVSGQGSNDGAGAAAQFNGPTDAVFDLAGNLYVADSENHTIRRITPAGVVTTFVGSAGNPGATDGTGAAARLNRPRGLAFSASGALTVADSGNHTLRHISPTGAVVTLAGAAGQTGSTDGQGSAARFNTPTGIVVGPSGDLFVTDATNHTIRRVTVTVPPNAAPVGTVTTFAGTAGSVGATDAVGTAARFFTPAGIARDNAGNLFVADLINHTIRRVTPAGVVSTLAGTALASGSTNANGTAARFNSPTGLQVDAAGNVYVADRGNHTVRRITPSGDVTTVAGTALASGPFDGTGSAARFASPSGLAIDATGTLVVADTLNHAIRRVTAAGVVTTFAGLPSSGAAVDETKFAARFNLPYALAVDRTGHVYVADTNNHVIRRIAPGGVVTVFAGSPGSAGTADGIGPAARFSSPRGIAVDGAGTVYVSDSGNHTIRKISPTGSVTTLAGSPGNFGTTDGPGAAARFGDPVGLAADANGRIYVADSLNSTLRRITPAGAVSTLAGAPGQSGSVDGTGTAARLVRPFGVAVDAAGTTVYVSDTGARVVRKVTSDGVATTLAGTTGVNGTADGTGPAAQFSTPAGLALDPTGTLFVVDGATHTLRRITAAGVVTTVGGVAHFAGSADGSVTARFRAPFGVAFDEAGTLYLADTFNHAVRWGATSLPSLRSAETATGAVGQTFSYHVSFFSALAGPYEAGELPDGLSLNSATGLIGGTPTVSGRFPLVLRATNGAGTGTATVTLTINAPPSIATQPRDLTLEPGQPASFRVDVDGFPAPTLQWHKNGVAIPGAIAATFTIASAGEGDVAGYSVVATNPLGSVTSRAARLVTIAGFPTVLVPPAGRAIAEGASLTLAATAAGNGPLTYQWFRDGTALAGATSSSLGLRNVTSIDAGAYAVTIANAVGSVTSEPATVTVAPASALANLSIRTGLTASQTLIVGAVVRDGIKSILVRAAGPALAAFGLAGVLDPRLEVYAAGSTPVATNDDWSPNLAGTFAALAAFPFPPGSRDAAVVQPLNGAVTFQARATGPGAILVEAYDATGGLAARLVNLSARSRVGTEADILIAGFNLTGTSTKQVLIRAIGPGLAPFNVPGTLVDPSLQVLSAGGTVLASNDNWDSALAPTFVRVGGFPLSPGSRDAAVIVNLPAGASYTVQVAGADGGTGEALVEIYEVF